MAAQSTNLTDKMWRRKGDGTLLLYINKVNATCMWKTIYRNYRNKIRENVSSFDIPLNDNHRATSGIKVEKTLYFRKAVKGAITFDVNSEKDMMNPVS